MDNSVINSREFEVSMKIDRRDYYNFSLTQFRLYPPLNKKVFVVIALIVSLIITCVAGVKEHTKNKVLFLILFALTIFIICLVVFIVFITIIRLILRGLLKAVSNRMYKDLTPEFTLTISQDGIEQNTKDLKVKATWNLIIKVVENEEALYLFFNKKAAFVILKKCFDALPQYEQAKSFIVSKTTDIPILYKRLHKRNMK